MTMIEYAERLRDIISVLREAEYLARHEWLDRDMSAQPPEQGPDILEYIRMVDRYGVTEVDDAVRSDDPGCSSDGSGVDGGEIQAGEEAGAQR